MPTADTAKHPLSEKGGTNAPVNGNRPDHQEAHHGPEGTRLNNFLNATQRAAATRMSHRRLARYHGADWRRTGHTGLRLEECINALPKDVLAQMRADLFGKFGIAATIQGARWSLSELVDKTVTNLQGLYEIRFHRGTLTIKRGGRPFARLVLETEEQWAAGLATLNPTGTLDQAPPGVPRILVVCTFGLATGVVLRQKAERALQSLAVDAWLECVGAADAAARVRYADIVLATEDEAADVGPNAIAIRNHEYRTAIVENWIDGSEVRRKLAAALGVPARSRPLPARPLSLHPRPAGFPVASVPVEAVTGGLSLPRGHEGRRSVR